MIPKIVHLCFGMTPDFGGKPWSLVHHACVKSMAERLKPDLINFYYTYEPSGPWWELTRPLLSLVPIEPPTSIFGNPLVHPAHRADIVRLEKLIEHGGVYLDCDVFVERSFDELLGHQCVLGQQDQGERTGLCNGVILAEKNARFLRRWHETYRTFRSKGRDDFWSEHSVRVPARLAKEDASDLTILDNRAFHWPLFYPDHLELTFRLDPTYRCAAGVRASSLGIDRLGQVSRRPDGEPRAHAGHEFSPLGAAADRGPAR